ncbi:prepilin-type N-terminal cleavage/methylation domain-containing protein [Planomicrobium sp. MB-3u-38]|uniref:prepilin-type N-terminal cleavage/methylation domain-containing protein n=1 Tax=Planomicrobium sp. MB-3u-38 TaxID=2058318 RepID=UPI000C7BB026|nr:prepilin-type N-terminal cleavage/methylation domain-containing protein [Planomicrobium sp. MB-3u-38]PKH08465.1 Tfp assembly type protein [Planomicrobium sp. MB-3u-38]
MKKFIQNKLKEQKGLTLIELLAVIVILAIIAAIAIPAIGNIIENSRYSAVKSDALNALSAANIYFAENPEKTSVTISELASGYLDNAGTLNTTLVATNVVTKTDGVVEITHANIEYASSKNVAFDEASVADINADTNKGSGDGGYTID